jgi:AcrR family transcriptional regulator
VPDAAVSFPKLPKGRHSLSRAQVAEAQKLRLAIAMAEVMAEKGYVGTSVADILRRAGISRLTFYELYDDKLACFLDALDFVGEVLVTELGAALAADRRADPGDPVVQAGQAVGRYLDTIVEHRSFARLYLVEAHAAGPEALRRRAALQDRVVDALAGLLGARSARRRFACQAYVAAIATLVTVPIVTGDDDAIRALRRPLIDQLRLVAG